LCLLVNIFGNLEALRVVTIISESGGRVYGGRDEWSAKECEEVESLYRQAFASALDRVRLPIELRLDGTYFLEDSLQ
jgi:hypothetical protein